MQRTLHYMECSLFDILSYGAYDNSREQNKPKPRRDYALVRSQAICYCDGLFCALDKIKMIFESTEETATETKGTVSF